MTMRKGQQQKAPTSGAGGAKRSKTTDRAPPMKKDLSLVPDEKTSPASTESEGEPMQGKIFAAASSSGVEAASAATCIAASAKPSASTGSAQKRRARHIKAGRKPDLNKGAKERKKLRRIRMQHEQASAAPPAESMRDDSQRSWLADLEDM